MRGETDQICKKTEANHLCYSDQHRTESKTIYHKNKNIWSCQRRQSFFLEVQQQKDCNSIFFWKDHSREDYRKSKDYSDTEKWAEKSDFCKGTEDSSSYCKDKWCSQKSGSEKGQVTGPETRNPAGHFFSESYFCIQQQKDCNRIFRW